jgi:hypothetical protein
MLNPLDLARSLDGGLSLVWLASIFFVPFFIFAMFYPAPALAAMGGLAVLTGAGLLLLKRVGRL